MQWRERKTRFNVGSTNGSVDVLHHFYDTGGVSYAYTAFDLNAIPQDMYCIGFLTQQLSKALDPPSGGPLSPDPSSVQLFSLLLN